MRGCLSHQRSQLIHVRFELAARYENLIRNLTRLRAGRQSTGMQPNATEEVINGMQQCRRLDPVTRFIVTVLFASSCSDEGRLPRLHRLYLRGITRVIKRLHTALQQIRTAPSSPSTNDREIGEAVDHYGTAGVRPLPVSRSSGSPGGAC